MELGRIPEIDQAKVNYTQKIEKVQESDNSQKIDPNEQYKNAGVKDNKNLSEVILDNVKFGYNKESQDFFIKIKRGNDEFKYPTEDMMKLKAQMLELLSSQIEN